MKTKFVPILIFVLLGSQIISHAMVHTVGPNGMYASPNALYLANVMIDGDTILIDAQTYTGNAALCVFQQNNLYIKGINGRPHMRANGSYIWSKGTWVFAGNNTTVENIEFSGSSVPDENGAGIRLDGSGLTVKSCYFHDNENGILTSNPGTGDILIEYSEFAYNGFGDGQSHNLYIGRVASLTFRYNYSHHAKIGHNLKSRAKTNAILYNRIMDEDTGTSSYLMDLSNGGNSLVMGNLFMQGPNTDNCNLTAYALEGFGAGYGNALYFIHNTLVNKRSPGCSFVNANNTSTGLVANNLVVGPGTLVSAPIPSNNNLMLANVSLAGFVAEATYDYKLQSNAPAIDYGAILTNPPGYDLKPLQSYIHPYSFQSRTLQLLPDVGAYEYESVLAIGDEEGHTVNVVERSAIQIFPNPVNQFIYLSNAHLLQTEFHIFDAQGRLVMHGTVSKTISLNNLQKGIYWLQAYKKNNGSLVTLPFIVNE